MPIKLKNALISISLLLFLFLLPGYEDAFRIWKATLYQLTQKKHPNPTYTCLVPMRDGIRLATDVYLPPGEGPWPVILLRTPYNKLPVNIPTQFTENGYGVVIQNTRGRYKSEGIDIIYQTDGWGTLQDGYDTCSWIVTQTWCNGKIGTLGNSAMGITQCLLAPTQPPGLTCQVIGFAPGDFYDDWAFTGDAPLHLWKEWLKRQGALWLYGESCNHFPKDEWWDKFNFIKVAPRINVPVLHITGWYDIWAAGAIRRFQSWQKNGGTGAKGNQKLLIGPWTHETTNGVVGCEGYPTETLPNPDILVPRFFDYWLKGEENGLYEEPPISYWEMTSPDKCNDSGWRKVAHFPHTESKAFFFNAEMTLINEVPNTARSVSFIYNPRSPWSTIGGSTLLGNAGPKDVSKELKKDHHILFMTNPLEEQLKVTGEIQSLLYVETNVPCADLVAILLDILPDGRNIILVDGIKRLKFSKDVFLNLPLTKPGEAIPLSLGWTSYVFPSGHRIGIVITGGNWPRFERNPQNGKIHYIEEDARPAHYNVFFGGDKSSQLLLPVVLS